MKRQPIVPQPNPYMHGVFKVWPLFTWHKCECCKREFRQERGWRYLGGPFHGGRGTWRYLCGSCATTWVDANTKANRLVCGEVQRNRQPPSPAPPADYKAISVEASPGLSGCSIEQIQRIEKELDHVMVRNGFTRTTTTKSGNRMAFNYRQHSVRRERSDRPHD